MANGLAESIQNLENSVRYMLMRAGNEIAIIRCYNDLMHELQDSTIPLITDDVPRIIARLKEWIESPQVDVVVTTGGTGLTGRDSTPEAFAAIVEKEIPGFGELFRMLSFEKIGTSTVQSRALAGVAGGTYLFALPGSTSACKDGWDDILRYQLDIRHRPCNFVEIMPRLNESATTRRTG